MTLRELAQRSNQWIAQIDSTVADVVSDNPKLLDLNRDQMRRSTLADGTVISRDYALSYAFWKKKYYPKSYADGRVNLFLTGELYGNMKIKSNGRVFNISTNVYYAPGLVKKYGEYLGIAPDNQPVAKNITGKALADDYKRKVLS